jgi:iron complex outermembrane receptor protein
LPKFTRIRLIHVIGLVSAALLITDVASAALDEIVVTTRKREEKLQELPMSVSAMDAATMNRRGVNDLADISRYTPGLDLDQGFGLNDQRLVIRGLAPSRGRPNSATLVDGIDMTTESVSTPGGSILFNSRLLDLERVEVIKGPQSALYGRAAFAGAIQYITKNPGDELETDLSLDLGEYGRRYASAGIGGPVNDKLGLRFSAMNWNEDGFYDEGFTGSSLGGGDGYGLSLTAKWDVTDNFSARGRVAYSDEDFDQQAAFYDSVNTLITPPDSAQVLDNINPDTVVGLFSGKPRDADGRTSFLTANPVTGSAYPGGELEILNTSLTLSWDVASGTFTSSTGFANADSQQQIDGDFDARPNAAGTLDIARGGTEINFATETRMFSQELRYASNLDGPVQFTVGANFWDESVDQLELSLSVLEFPFGQGNVNSNPGHFNLVAQNAIRLPNIVERDTQSRSVYGLIEWDLAEDWKLTLEGRYAREQMDVVGSGCDPDQPVAAFRCIFSSPDIATPQFPPGSGVFPQRERVRAVEASTDYYVAPRAMLEWTPSDNLLTYFSISKGVKPGGIGTIASGSWMDQEPDGDLDELEFDAEKLIAYEIGAKSSWFERTLTVNAALFYQDYSDKQIPVQTIVNGFPVVAIDNAGEADVLGLELETVWQAADNVRLQFSYTYLDGEYTDLVYQTNSQNGISRAGNCTPVSNDTFCKIDLSGHTLEDIPEHSAIAVVGYYPPLGGGGLNGLLEVDAQYQGSRFADEFNDREVDSYTLYNARVGVESDSWDVLVYVNNVFDDDTIKNWVAGIGLVATAERPVGSSLSAFPSDGFSIAPPPRHWGIRANLRF